MHITYDKKSDSKYVKFFKKGKAISRTEKVAEWLLVDYSKEGDIAGVEILNASKHPGVLMTVADQVLYALQPESLSAPQEVIGPDSGELKADSIFSHHVYA